MCLQRCLNHLQLLDALYLRITELLIIKLTPLRGKKCCVCSVDIKDLYYLLEQMVSLNKLKQLLELNLVSFQSGAGSLIGYLLCLIDFYLKPTVTDVNQKGFVKKSGICIGLSLAPAKHSLLSCFYISAT